MTKIYKTFYCTNVYTASGLTSSQAQERFAKYGENKLKAKKKKSTLVKFFEQFKDVMTIVLFVCTGISAFMQDWVEAIVMVGIVIINAALGFVQEFRTEKTIEALRSMTRTETF